LIVVPNKKAALPTGAAFSFLVIARLPLFGVAEKLRLPVVAAWSVAN
jgi:hypothetical protein